MQNFPEFQNENMGGCQSFEFTPFRNISQIPPVNGNKCYTDLYFIGDADYYSGQSILDTLQYQEQLQTSDAGTFFKVKIVGFVPFLSEDYLDLFDQMKQLRHVVKIKDNNGKYRLFGLNGGLSFSFDTDSKKSPSGANGFEYVFSGENPKPAPFLL